MTKKSNKKMLTKDLMITKKNDIKIKYAYFIIIIIGIVFTCLSCFHTSLWFDESYSISIAHKTFTQIWTIGSHDVHPVLYYWLLKVIMILTNENLICCRLFSTVPLIIMSILGYTHIRKDFGEKTGLIFSFLSLFMPVCLIYAGEVRMYTWAMLFVTIMAIYAFRIYKDGFKNKNWIIFSIFSLSSAYTHYYGLITAFVINIGLFIYFATKIYKERKTTIKTLKYKQNFIRSIISAIIQIIMYLPWIGTLLNQTKAVSKGFWIGLPNIPELIEFPIGGNLGETIHIPVIIAWIFTIAMLIYIIILLKKNWKNSKTAKITLLTYAAVVGTVAVISIFVRILYARYLLNIEGLLIFLIAYLMSKENNKEIIAVCSIIVIVSTIANVNLITTNYDKSNSEPLKYIQENMEENDILITDNNGSGFVIIAEANFKGDKVYFWDRAHWNVGEAYKAYGNTVYDLDMLKDYKGKIWIVSSGNFNLANDVKNTLENVEIKDEKYFNVKYEHYEFAISLAEKTN